MNRKYSQYFYGSILSLAITSCSLLTIRVMTMEMPILDQWASPFVQHVDGTFIFRLFRWITELGSGSFLTPFSLVMGLFLWLYYKDSLAACVIVIGTYTGYLANYGIKLLVERERPRILAEAEGVGHSFPSGHAMVALIAYGLFTYFLIKHAKSKQIAIVINVIGIVMILLIGFSRYVIRVHYLTDVLAGYSFGALFLFAWIGIYHLLSKIKISFFSVSRRR
ncbi:phosphatase PAP2 family protein [Radiobacillus sp. PE A8.2]|uniref:phosphatase PAP2 family protein n=1 Tax=Radiobacillus sp. PE A8.2 TaxID=3380349 RepID=UPI00388E54D0